MTYVRIWRIWASPLSVTLHRGIRKSSSRKEHPRRSLLPTPLCSLLLAPLCSLPLHTPLPPLVWQGEGVWLGLAGHYDVSLDSS